MMQSTNPGKPTKSEMVRKALQTRGGASLSRLCEATGWQQHSVRAALSRLRKAGYTIERRAAVKPGSEVRYRMTGQPGGV